MAQELESGSGTEEECETEGVTEPVTEAAEALERDVHYEVTGDLGSWYRDTNGLLWIQAGTAIYAEPISGSGYNTGSSLENLTADGLFSFTLKKVKKDGTVAKESTLLEESYCVDGEAPSARFQISGNQVGDKIYASGTCSVSVSVEPDGKSGLKGTSYKILPCDINGSVSENAESAAWTDCGSAATVLISEEGLYRVYVKTVDMVGNITYSRSSIICVDGTAPVITIEGVGDQTANSGSVCLSVNGTDTWFKAGSLQVSIVGANQGNVPALKESGSNDSGAWMEYSDFPELQSYDDVYTVSVTAEDLAGNIGKTTIQFSINRFGSAYDLSAETKALLEQYFLSEACDVVFYEMNIDYVGESDIYCRHEGVLRELIAGVDYQISMEGSESTWKRYCYTVSADYFSREGVYELLLVSRDAAQNQSDTGIQQKRVTFVVDWTVPSCTISGIKSGEIYESETAIALVVPTDNLGLKCLRIYHNSELLMENNSQPVSGEAVKVTLESSQEWQTLQSRLCDMAGNADWSEEIPVFVSAAGERVPVYEKPRKSAMELAEEAAAILQGADGKEESENVSMEQNEASTERVEDINAEKEEVWENGASEKTETELLLPGTASDTQYSGGNRTMSDERGILSENRDNRIGWVILMFGVLIFAITMFSVYPMFWKRLK
ncbi:MAG: Ig-like domain-containing protein [Clostridiales bacterium]|nr:Ig-like domain-containing protein [Clostridiales bacterium]